MALFQNLSIFITFLLLTLAFPFAKAASFDVRNNCDFTVWAAAIPGGGRQLDPGQTWSLNVNASTMGRIWARTNCSFDGAGSGRCQTGDCGGVLQCTANGQPPNTLVEYALNQHNNLDFFAISVVDGFNVPMEFSPTSNGCTRRIRCTADIKGKCPNELKAPGGCNNPCTVFKTDEYCCNSGSCGPTNYSRFFKDRCPDAYSYPKDDPSSTTFSCNGGTNYRVVFCPKVFKAQMHIQNNCSYTVWAAAIPRGGRQLNQGETWSLNATDQGRIWGRTNCIYEENGRLKCDSGDCDGFFQCQTVGRAPYTLAEYSIGQDSVTNMNISLVNGFNVPMEFSPSNTSSNSKDCQRIKCAADINEPCPMELRDPGGCNNPCTVFRNEQFCCYSAICQPTSYSKFFKQLCPDAYSYLHDDATSISCPTGGRDYINITFCP